MNQWNTEKLRAEVQELKKEVEEKRPKRNDNKENKKSNQKEMKSTDDMTMWENFQVFGCGMMVLWTIYSIYAGIYSFFVVSPGWTCECQNTIERIVAHEMGHYI